MTESPSPEVPLDQPEHPEVGDTDAQRRQDQNRLDNTDPGESPPEDRPPDKATVQEYENEGGAAADGPVAIT